MSDISQPAKTSPPDPKADRAEKNRRGAKRLVTKLNGRLGYGGNTPGLVGCNVLDISTSGARVETFMELENLPETFSVEVSGVYTRARLCWISGKLLGLSFIKDDTSYFNIP